MDAQSRLLSLPPELRLLIIRHFMPYRHSWSDGIEIFDPITLRWLDSDPTFHVCTKLSFDALDILLGENSVGFDSTCHNYDKVTIASAFIEHGARIKDLALAVGHNDFQTFKVRRWAMRYRAVDAAHDEFLLQLRTDFARSKGKIEAQHPTRPDRTLMTLKRWLSHIDS